MNSTIIQTEKLGTVVAMSAGLQLVIADAKAAHTLNPEDAPTMDYKKIIPVLVQNETNMGVIFSFSIHRGYGDIFRKGNELVVMETYMDDDSERMSAANPELNKSESVQGTFTVTSGAIALFAAEFLFASEEDGEAVKINEAIDSVLKSGGAEVCDVQDGQAVIIALENGNYEVVLEKKISEPEKTQRLFLRQARK